MPFDSKGPSTPKVSKKFIEDRVGIPIDLEQLPLIRSYFVDQARSNFEWIELQFSDDDREWFLDTPHPSIADIHVAMNVWFLGVIRGAKEITNPNLYPKTYSWFNRFLKYIESNGTKAKRIGGEEALEIAKRFKP